MAKTMVGRRVGGLAFTAAAWSLLIASAEAAVAPKKAGTLRDKQLQRLEVYFGSGNAPLPKVLERLPNRAAWNAFAASRAADGSTFRVFIDPRSGTATNILGPVPLIPGPGVGNRVTLASLESRLGRGVEAVDKTVVAAATLDLVRSRHELLGIDVEQLGPARANRVSDELWRVEIPQRYRGVPVRDAFVLARVSHGNVVAVGAAGWSDVTLPDVTPALPAEAAVEAGFAYADGRSPGDQLLGAPVLEIVRSVPAEHPVTARFAGTVGAGYRHRLVWTFVFRRPPDVAQWEVMVDAESGKVVSFQDRVQYARRKVTGGVYPVTNTETCPANQTCGVMQSNWPMPFADTGFAAPHDFSNSAGVFDYTDGTGATTLSGRYFTIQGHAPLSEGSFLGAFFLGGVNGQHDLTSAGTSAGNTASARTAYYELNKIAEIARGYLPFNEALNGEPEATIVNEDDTCNAYYQHGAPPFPPFPGGPSSLHFLRSGQHPFDPATTCRNTGEIGEVLDHEWGHWFDDDRDGNSSRGGEAAGDIVAMYRTQSSCIGDGYYITNSDGCGAAPDGTGFNPNMAVGGVVHCATSCSGVREADWAKHQPATPDDFAGFVRHQCLWDPEDVFSGFSVHCAAAPIDQVAWDLVARDLTALPFNMDSETAFIVANRLFYHAIGGVFQWIAWDFPDGPTDGCEVASGYMEWLIADDDNGSLNDGTPHMSAIFNAFGRHGMACSEEDNFPGAPPTPVNSGCADGPSLAPTLTVTPGHYQNALSWTTVPGATRYWVFRTEGHAGCNYGKALIAEVEGLSYIDTEVAAGRPYYYNVVAVGSSSSCFSRVSTCTAATPTAGNYTVACSPGTLTLPGASTATCTVTSTGGYDSAVTLNCTGLPTSTSCQFNPPTVTPGPNGTAVSTLSVGLGPLTPVGVHAFKVQGWPRALPVVTGNFTDMTLVVGGAGSGGNAAFDPHLLVPRCSTPAPSCDTGTVLVRRRGALGEPNQPNTIRGSCADGSSPVSPQNGSSDRIRVLTGDGGPFAPGKTVRVDATVEARADFASDAADFFYASDAADPTWVLAGTVVPSGPGPQVLSAKYKLPVGELQAVRVQFRRQGHGGSGPCAPGSVNDRDDLAFAVAP